MKLSAVLSLALLLGSCGRSELGAIDAAGRDHSNDDAEAPGGDEPVPRGDFAGFASPIASDVELPFGLTGCDASTCFLTSVEGVTEDETRAVLYRYDRASGTSTRIDEFGVGPRHWISAVTVTRARDGSLYYLVHDYNLDVGPHTIVRRSTDDGASWTTVYAPADQTIPGDVFADLADGAVLVLAQRFTLTPDSGWYIVRSTDEGATWQQVDGYERLGYPTAIERVGTKLLALGSHYNTLVTPARSSWLVRTSDDEGVTWNDLGLHYTGEGPNLEAMNAFGIGGAKYITGRVRTDTGIVVRTVRLESNNTLTTVDDLSMPGLDVWARPALLPHSSGYLLSFVHTTTRDLYATGGTAYIRGTKDGVTFTTLYDGTADGIEVIYSAIVLPNGDLLASLGGSSGGVMRIPQAFAAP